MGGISHLLQKMSILRSEKETLAIYFKGVLFDVVGNLLNDKLIQQAECTHARVH